MPVATTTIEDAEPGYNYVVEFGREAFYDDWNNRVLDAPTHCVGGWAPSREEAQSEIDRILAQEEAA